MIPWATGKGAGGTEEHVLMLGGDKKLYDSPKDYVDPHRHGVVCEF